MGYACSVHYHVLFHVQMCRLLQPSSVCLSCRGGSDWERIKILEMNQNGTSKELNDTLGNVKFSATAWAPNSKVI